MKGSAALSRLFLLVIALCGLVACGSESGESSTLIQREGLTLEDTRWVLDTLAGKSAGPGSGGKPVDLQFQAEAMRAGGFSGCNRYFGSYSRQGRSQHGSPLTVGPTAGTRMACAEGGEVEHPYLQMLDRVTAFRLEGGSLSLLNGSEEVATFRPL